MKTEWETLKNGDIDELIKTAMEAHFNSIQCPPKEKVWNNIMKEVRKRRREEWLRRIRPMAAVVTVLLCLSILFINYRVPVLAFGSKIIKSVIEITGNSFKIHISNKETIESANTSENLVESSAEDIDNLDVIDKLNDTRISEAKNKVHFKLATPGYFPGGYTLKKVDILDENEKHEVVTYQYIKKEEGKDDNFICITQASTPEDLNYTINVLREKDTEMKQVKVEDVEYKLFFYDNRLVKIIWNNDSITYRVDANIGEDEAFKIAKSMR